MSNLRCAENLEHLPFKQLFCRLGLSAHWSHLLLFNPLRSFPLSRESVEPLLSTRRYSGFAVEQLTNFTKEFV